ncbi:hypothetical protein HNQ07_004506 [Deinococcus metalli]|uniref:Cas12f1-like TNB domain-containing protein n=1 Tax=Deinococcus metalli TaxID=1141878 RepID=A0A7W8NRI0_9DEIO|nr:zinc ribbon domain-containing protein [Deinococcus metalli]MBB5378996.1 hypothetical protein [Deinococcus metalli]GHF63492.1 hypothetical protein GCM10017781_44300 [Deinococcus metalli]
MPPPDPHIHLRHPLYPTPTQQRELDALWALARQIWRVLAVHARLEADGQPQSLQEVAALVVAGAMPPTSRAARSVPRRTTAERRNELEAVARALGWRAHLGSSTLDGLVQAFGRSVRALGHVADPACISLNPPETFALTYRGLARPVDDLHVEIAGISGLVLAPVYLMPGPARLAVHAWQNAFFASLSTTRSDLEAALLTGDTDAGARYLAHLARYGPLELHLAAARSTPALGSPITLHLAQGVQLHRSVAGDEISWAFQLTHLSPPRHQALLAIDPGQRALWTWITAHHGQGQVPNPLAQTHPWQPGLPTPPDGLVRRSHDLRYAHVRRHQLLYATQLQPRLERALAHFLTFAGVAIEDTALARMAQRGLDYAPFVAFSGTRQYERFLTDLAQHDPARRIAVWVPPEGTSVDCSVCGLPDAMRYWRRVGRCRGCGVRLDRDVNGARNIYQRAAAMWPVTTLPWVPAALPRPRRRGTR